jgi:hypothetical protein
VDLQPPSQVPIHAYVAALGYPLGEGISFTNGRVIGRERGHIALRILAAQGYSGGPVVDQYGRVAGVVNFGFGDPGAFTGHAVFDNIFAYDISSRWGGWRTTLCNRYPNGGIAECASSPASPTATAPSQPRSARAGHFLPMRDPALVAKSYQHDLNTNDFKQRCWALGRYVVTCRGLTLTNEATHPWHRWSTQIRKLSSTAAERRSWMDGESLGKPFVDKVFVRYFHISGWN